MITTMLRGVKEMQGYTIRATDGEIGKLHEFYFDDEFWMIRYLVADVGRWTENRKVLISPFAFEEPDSIGKIFPLRLDGEEILNAPGIDADEPVSRQHETDLHEYFQWTPYWTMPSLKGDPHLRGSREVLGYRLHAKDGDIGYVDDLIVNDADWAVHYLVVDTGNWLPGKKVLISPWWTDEISWEETKVSVGIPKNAIRHSPRYDFSLPVSRDYEDRLYNHYGKPKYWS